MKELTLDFSGLHSPLALHQYLKTVFELPDYYGHNMDALWDCLYHWYGEPVVIVLTHTQELSQRLPQSAQTLMALFQALEQQDPMVSLRHQD